MKAAEQLVHPFPPVWDKSSVILILGSFPSVKSRETAFFYGHPQNRFWRLVAALYEDAVPQTVEERRAFLLRHHIALWDVIASCSIVGSSDSSIRDTVYRKYLLPEIGREAVCLPSTSPANAAWSFDRLAEAWNVILGGRDPLHDLTAEEHQKS